MASVSPQKKSWIEIGSSTTSPKDNKTRAEVVVDDYYVVIGFEVNKSEAFKDETQDLGKDYGHAFFYLVKNKKVVKSFSFGPKGPGKIGWFDSGGIGGVDNKYDTGAVLKDGYKDSRPGSPDYHISEPVKVFKLKLTPKQARDLITETDLVREKINSGKQKYTAFMNDTCAETARDILKSANIDTPSGSGKIKHSGVASFPIAYAVNPYMWHHNFIKNGNTETSFDPPGRPEWHPPIGEPDPIFK